MAERIETWIVNPENKEMLFKTYFGEEHVAYIIDRVKKLEGVFDTKLLECLFPEELRGACVFVDYRDYKRITDILLQKNP